MTSERIVVEQVARYIQLKYPHAVYRFDLAADLKLTIGQASRHKRLHPKRGYPDLMIAHPSSYYSDEGSVETASGLFLEIKKEGVRLRKVRSDEWDTEHIAEQVEMLATLNRLGYVAKFAVGYDECVATIDAYMGNKVRDDGKPF